MIKTQFMYFKTRLLQTSNKQDIKRQRGNGAGHIDRQESSTTCPIFTSYTKEILCGFSVRNREHSSSTNLETDIRNRNLPLECLRGVYPFAELSNLHRVEWFLAGHDPHKWPLPTLTLWMHKPRPIGDITYLLPSSATAISLFLLTSLRTLWSLVSPRSQSSHFPPRSRKLLFGPVLQWSPQSIFCYCLIVYLS